MVKRIAKYAFKSGVLPKPRQVVAPFKTPLEIKHEEKENLGFRDPELIPQGSAKRPNIRVAARVPLKQRTPVEEILKNTTKAPLEANNSRRPDWRSESAKMRRAYLNKSLADFEQDAKRDMESRAKREERLERDTKRKANPFTTQSNALALTLPTIESFLTSNAAKEASEEDTPDKTSAAIQDFISNSQFVVPRTKEEQELLDTQRKANYKRKQLTEAEHRAKLFLEIYQSSDSYITTEDALKQTIDREFIPSSLRDSRSSNTGYFGNYSSDSLFPGSLFPDPSHSSANVSALANSLAASEAGDATSKLSESQIGALNSLLFRDLYGVSSVNNKPGLAEVEDAISGVTTQNRKALDELVNQEYINKKREEEQQQASA